jgi:hypothetical protein
MLWEFELARDWELARVWEFEEFGELVGLRNEDRIE